MFDWYIIEYLYPNSFKKFSETMFPNVGVICVSSLSIFNEKNLYRFFDKEGIYLNLEMYSKNQWVFTISMEDGRVLSSDGESKTNRIEIEHMGFNECFKILEKKKFY
jgi:hypothetical protein